MHTSITHLKDNKQHQQVFKPVAFLISRDKAKWQTFGNSSDQSISNACQPSLIKHGLMVWTAQPHHHSMPAEKYGHYSATHPRESGDKPTHSWITDFGFSATCTEKMPPCQHFNLGQQHFPNNVITKHRQPFISPFFCPDDSALWIWWQ